MAAGREHPDWLESLDSSQVLDGGRDGLIVEDFFRTLSDDEISELRENEKKLKNFCCKLLRWYKNNERRIDEFDHVRSVIRRISANSAHLQQLIDNLKPNRQRLVESLRAKANKMSVLTTVCSATKLATSVIDSVGVIGNLVVKQSETVFIDMTLEAAKFGGYLGIATSAIETLCWKAIMDDVIEEIQIDSNLFLPILEWFQRNSELQEAINAVFPLHLTTCIVEEFEKSIGKSLSSLDALQEVLRAVLKHDQEQLNNVRLIENLVAFTTSPVARDLCRWILQHPTVTLDLANVLLRLKNLEISDSSQNSATLIRIISGSQTTAYYLRLVLNCMSICNAFDALKTGGLVEELKKLERHFQQEMNTLTEIAQEIRSSNLR